MSQQKVFEEMLKDLKEQVLSEMRSSSPDDEKIARIAQDIENLDMKIEHLKSVNSFKPVEQEGNQDEVQEQKMELTSEDLAKVRWAYTPGEKDAMGCITLNPNKKQKAIHKG